MKIEDVEKLKRNNQELQEIINNSWDGIAIIDKSTKFVYVNNAFVPILGFSKDELINNNFTSLMEKKYVNNFLSSLEIKDKNKKHQAEIDIICIRKDTKKVYLKITISSMLKKNLFVINTKDITALISDDEIHNDYVISMYLDLHGHITKVSSAFLKLTGFKQTEIIGKAFSSFAHKDSDAIIYKNISKSLENQQEYSGKLKKRKKDGTAFWIDIKIKPIYNKYGDVTGYTSLMFDITSIINLNDEASMLQEQVQRAKNEIIEKDNLLIQQSKQSIMTETLQRLSHEWRQPLNLISIKAQKLELDYLMENNPTIDYTVETLEKIKSEANLLSKTIENFQKFLEPKSKKEIIKPSSIIKNAISIFEENSKIDINIIKEINDDIEFESYFDELSTVLLNILTNAKEAIVEKHIKNAVIKISEYVINDTIYFEITDNAGGINSDIIHKVFEPYFSTKDEKHGVGLGLYTSKIIVNLHLNGIITVNNYNTGANFKISLPIK